MCIIFYFGFVRSRPADFTLMYFYVLLSYVFFMNFKYFYTYTVHQVGEN